MKNKSFWIHHTRRTQKEALVLRLERRTGEYTESRVPRLERRTGLHRVTAPEVREKDRWIYRVEAYQGENHCRNRCPWRKTWTVTGRLLEAQLMSLGVKNFRGTQGYGSPTILWSVPLRAQPDYHSKYQRKTPKSLAGRKEKEPLWNRWEQSVPSGNPSKQTLPCWRVIRASLTWGSTQRQLALAILSHLTGGTLLKFTAQRPGSLKDWDLIVSYRTLKPPHTPHHHITKSQFTADPFTWRITSSYQEKSTRHTERQKNTIWIGKASVRTRHSRDAGMMRPTTIHILKSLKEKVDDMQEQKDGQCQERDENPKKEPKRNAATDTTKNQTTYKQTKPW